jgi:uncharacterized protein YdcH (DUF465 family)
METRLHDELKERLIETNEEFRRMAEEHRTYEARLQELSSRAFLTDEEQVEELRLKKLKLHLKDRMEEMILQHEGVAS